MSAPQKQSTWNNPVEPVFSIVFVFHEGSHFPGTRLSVLCFLIALSELGIIGDFTACNTEPGFPVGEIVKNNVFIIRSNMGLYNPPLYQKRGIQTYRT